MTVYINFYVAYNDSIKVCELKLKMAAVWYVCSLTEKERQIFKRGKKRSDVQSQVQKKYIWKNATGDRNSRKKEIRGKMDTKNDGQLLTSKRQQQKHRCARKIGESKLWYQERQKEEKHKMIKYDQ